MEITVHTVVGVNTLPFYEYFLRNYYELAMEKDKLHFFCYALDGSAYRKLCEHGLVAGVERPYLAIRNYCYGTVSALKRALKCLFTFNPYLDGSYGHGCGLNCSAKLFDRFPGIQIVADSDTTMLQVGWDTSLRTIMEKADIFGAPYEDIGGFSSGNGKVQTYKKCPSGVWVALGPRIDWSHLDWIPAKSSNLVVQTEEQSRRYNLPVGYELVRDVGWTIPDYVADRGGVVRTLSHVKPSSPACIALKTGYDYHEEYQLDGVPFLAHHRGSRQFPFRDCDMSASFYDAVEVYLSGK